MATPPQPCVAATLPYELKRRIVWHHMKSVVDPMHYRTLRAICLVSKAWLPAGSEFLYFKLFFDFSDWVITVNKAKLVETLKTHPHLRTFPQTLRLVTEFTDRLTVMPILAILPSLPNLEELEIWCEDDLVDDIAAVLEQMPQVTLLLLHCDVPRRLARAVFALENLTWLELWHLYTDPLVVPKFRLKGLLIAEPITRKGFEELTVGVCPCDDVDIIDLSPFHRVWHVHLFPPEQLVFEPARVVYYLAMVISSTRDLPELVMISLEDRQRTIGRRWDEFQPADGWLLEQLPPSLKMLDLSAAQESFDPNVIIEYVADTERSPKLEMLRLRNDAIWAEDKEDLEDVAKGRGVELQWMRNRDDECVIC
ncbi:hypothetical protein JCM10449v2_006319 [Rhodotorula kratochvilovae]